MSRAGDIECFAADSIVSATHLGSNTYSRKAKLLRDKLKKYFNDKGQLDISMNNYNGKEKLN